MLGNNGFIVFCRVICYNSTIDDVYSPNHDTGHEVIFIRENYLCERDKPPWVLFIVSC